MSNSSSFAFTLPSRFRSAFCNPCPVSSFVFAIQACRSDRSASFTALSRFTSPGSVSGDVVTVVPAVVFVEPDDVICMIDAVVEVVAAERDVDEVADDTVDDVVARDTEETVVCVRVVSCVSVDTVCEVVRVVSEYEVVCCTVCEVVSDAETRVVLVSVVLLLPAESDVSGVVDVVVRMLSVSVNVVVVSLFAVIG